MDRYRHKPLESGRQIRLVHLEQPRNNRAPLRCQIKEVCLDHDPEYSAMSYAWDAEEPTVPLICGSRILFITPNCEKGLRRFVNIPAGQVLWVDSICIDQDSTLERNHQVNVMGSIYSQASTVLVWLGESNLKTLYAFDQLRNLGEQGTSAERMSQPFRNEEVAKRTDMIPLLFEKSWFQRAWVVQEVSLPDPNRVLVFCGKTYIRWKHLIRGVLKFGDVAPNGVPECMDVFVYLHGLLGPNRRVATDFEMACAPSTSHQIAPLRVRRPFTLLLSKARRKKCQDPRDRIFALHSIFKALLLQPSTYVPDPDYQKSYASVEAEIQEWVSYVERDNGVSGIESLSISSPRSLRPVSKQLIRPIGVPLLPIRRYSSKSSEEITKCWNEAKRLNAFSEKSRFLYDDQIFPDLITQAHCCWMLARWIETIVGLAFPKSDVDEFRANKAISSKGAERLWNIFCKVCPPLSSDMTWKLQAMQDQFKTWVDALLWLPDLNFPDWRYTPAADEKCSLDVTSTSRWTQCQPWWPAIGLLNTDTYLLHRKVTDYCLRRTMAISNEGDVIILGELQRMIAEEKEDVHVFLVRHEDTTMVRVLMEDEWSWAQGCLYLYYHELGTTRPERRPNHLVQEESEAIYIPKEDILPPKRTERCSSSTEEAQAHMMKDTHARAESATVTTGRKISYGTEDTMDAWWPSWFL